MRWIYTWVLISFCWFWTGCSSEADRYVMLQIEQVSFLMQSYTSESIWRFNRGRLDILNVLGNIYKARGDKSFIDNCLQKTVEYDLEDLSLNYLALAKFKFSQQNYEKARFYSKQVKHPINNKETAIEIPYIYCHIEKQLESNDEALTSLKLDVTLADSILFEKK